MTNKGERTVLIITRYFPPAGGGGVMRVLKFAKYLPAFGWKPIIVTASINTLVKDDSLLHELPKDALVFRTKPSRLTEWKFQFLRTAHSQKTGTSDTKKKGMVTRFFSTTIRIIERLKKPLESWIFLPDQEIGWVSPATHLAKQVLRENHVNAIITSGPPHSVHSVGMKLSKELKLPWLLDFRDDWYTNPLFMPTTAFGQHKVERMEKEIVHRATALMTVTPPIRDGIATRYPDLPDSMFHTIWNGYDQEDFESPLADKSSSPQLHLCYLGSFGTTRTSSAILDGFTKLKERRPDLFQKLRVSFIGQFTDDRKPWVLLFGGALSLQPFLPHSQGIETIRQADALLLVLTEQENGRTAMTGKIFEYMAARRPIVGLTCPGIAKDFIESKKLGWTAEVKDADAIYETFTTILEQWSALGHLDYSPDKEVIEQFSRRRQAEQLAALLQKISHA